MDISSITPSARTKEKYMALYNEMENLYQNQFYSVSKACSQLRISVNQYYRICKTLGKPSVATAKHVPSSVPEKSQPHNASSKISTPISNWIECSELKIF